MELDGVVKKSYVQAPDWSVHKKKELKGDQGVAIPQSQLLYIHSLLCLFQLFRISQFFFSTLT